MTTYRYDIGFTFLDRDEALVRRLVEKLGPEVSTFFAPERQREIVGTDGVLTFSAVYRKESRTVAIVYGEDWGSTRWTAVEQQAIRERAFEAHSYDFATMIPIGTPIPRIPDWFPSTRVYADFSRLGEEGVVACLKERVVRFGGTAPDETAVDMATRLNREQQRAREVRSFLNSQAGVRAADSSVAEIFDTLERLAPECQAKFERNDQAHITAISRDYITVSLVWERYSNAVER